MGEVQDIQSVWLLCLPLVQVLRALPNCKQWSQCRSKVAWGL